jgi:hypothetical protein
MQPHVFVSYSQPDRQCAMELVARVEAHGMGVWIAPRDVHPAADWAAEIIDAISSARVMVLVLSASSSDSPQVRREVERAVSKQVMILPFRIDDSLPSKSLEYFLSTQHWLDAFPPPMEPHYLRLCGVLEASLSVAVPAANRPAATATSAAIDETTLSGVESLLAHYLGPVARVLVRRALAQVLDREQLAQHLAVELDSDLDRGQFINACRRLGQVRR